MTFYWWNDAVGFAFEMATQTLMPHKVYRTAAGWTVDLADRAVMEPCS